MLHGLLSWPPACCHAGGCCWALWLLLTGFLSSWCDPSSSSAGEDQRPPSASPGPVLAACRGAGAAHVGALASDPLPCWRMPGSCWPRSAERPSALSGCHGNRNRHFVYLRSKPRARTEGKRGCIYIKKRPLQVACLGLLFRSSSLFRFVRFISCVNIHFHLFARYIPFVTLQPLALFHPCL